MELMRYLDGAKYILFYHILYLGRYICVLGYYIWFSKKAIGFWGNKKMFEVTDIRKYNHAMSKFYVVHGMVFIFLGLPLLTGAHKWIILSVTGAVVETIVLMAVYSLVIKKKYKK
ncbi:MULTISPECIES: hypothetical protein [environmental samples]|uniref:hypothetical protein n=1 Tax=environmental samples TaxID=876090 RepID=UPI000AFF7EF2|nr:MULTISPECIES: hypothetical protein [environmental samples]